MELLFDFGLEATRWLQTTFPALQRFFEFISLLGLEIVYLLFLSLIYWSINKKLGRHVAYLFLLSTFVNIAFKHLFRGPRVFWLDPELNIMTLSPGYGIPSGHVQGATVLALFFAQKIKKKWFWYAAILYILLMMVSRVYLGQHFVHDVVAGFFIGFVILIAYWVWHRQLHQAFTKRILGFRLMIAILVPAFAAILYTAVFFLMGPPNLNVAWADFIPLAERESIEGIVTAVGSLFGAGIGLTLEKSRIRFRADGKIWQRVGRYLVGIVVAGVIWAGLGNLFPAEPLALAIPLRFLRYTLLTLWVTYYAPWLFVLTRLASADPEPGIDISLRNG